METAPGYRILLVEDDEKIARILKAELERYGHRVVVPSDLAHIKEEFLAQKPDLVILDINLPRYDGYHWCRQIRMHSTVPIIFLSARDQDVDQVRALESGGDDYISKPFSLELAVAKVNSLLRRTYGEYAWRQEPDVLQIDDVIINRSNNTVSRRGLRVELSAKEFRLLWLLAKREGEIVGRAELLEVLWDDVAFVDDNTLTVNVTRLRHRLAALDLDGAVETRRGQGYRLNLKHRDSDE